MREKGFTLIELIVVMAILAILAGLAVPQYLQIQARKEKEACYLDMEMVKRAYDTNRAQNPLYSPAGGPAQLVKEVAQKLDAESSSIFIKDICPKGGRYIIALSGDYSSIDSISCSVHGSDEGAYVATSSNIIALLNTEGAMVELKDYFVNRTGNSVDSTAPGGSDFYKGGAAQLVAGILEENGLSTSGTWRVVRTSEPKIEPVTLDIYWSDKDITKMDVGDTVRVVKYSSDGTRVGGTVTVRSKTTGSSTYNVLGNSNPNVGFKEKQDIWSEEE